MCAIFSSILVCLVYIFQFGISSFEILKNFSYAFLLFVFILFILVLRCLFERRKPKKEKRKYIYRTGRKDKKKFIFHNCNVYIYYDEYGNSQVQALNKKSNKLN